MFKIINKEIQWGGKTLSLETGKVARQANGSIIVKYGKTTVLCTATAKKTANPDIDFFPLTVNYQEKYYAAGKIPGGFFKREGRSTEKETLISRLIDRPLRPMFHDNFKNETQVMCTVLSYDKENDADIIAMIGASAALAISEIPLLTPIAGARIGYIEDKLVLNPTNQQLAESSLDLVVAGTDDSILMVESQVDEFTEEKMLEALKLAQESFKPVINLINDLVKECGKEKWQVESNFDNELYEKVSNQYSDKILAIYDIKEKQSRQSELEIIRESIKTEYLDEQSSNLIILEDIIKKLEKKLVRDRIFDNKRIDDRALDQVRPIASEIKALPMVHGSALFTRGETQALAVVTLGAADDEQIIDGLDGNNRDKFMLHYNFPPYSVGEVGMLRGPGRREIGHGKLAKRALIHALPQGDDFPYTVRIVSEVTESNGSSSMATICASSLALMDAGVEIKKPVAGIAMGLVKEGNKYSILSDIMGDEDHLGDMDFKVAGTDSGINALQMDIKIKGITFEIMEKALLQAKQGRLHILKEMAKTISEPSTEFNENVPIFSTMKVAEAKIRQVIGQGGKVIKKLCEDTGCKISIDDSGVIQICAPDKASSDDALAQINAIVEEPEVGKIYDGIVQKVTNYGAFVGFLNNHSGLIHISEFANKRIDSVEEFVSEGDEITFKIIGRDGDKLKLSYKAVNNNAEESDKINNTDDQDEEINKKEDNKKKKKGLFW